MDLDNQEPTDNTDAAPPRKRASRRVVSTDLVADPAAAAAPEGEAKPKSGSRGGTRGAKSTGGESPETNKSSGKPQTDLSDPSGAAESGEGAPDSDRPRRRRAAPKKDDTSATTGDTTGSESSSDDSGEGGDDGGDEGGNGYNRGRGRGRGRDRRRGRGSFGEDGEPEVSDDDVLIPIGGILDVLDNYAFVRTQGYLPGPTDVYVSLGQVKKYNLRKGDAVIGAIRQPREGDNQGRQKYNALVSVDSVNGQTVDEAATRVDFAALTAVYPTERLVMETTSENLTGRALDLFTPIGKGQRGVIVGAPKTGKSMIVQAIAAAVAENTPDAHLMVVLIDEHPEAITELQRHVKGEVIASTFDRGADDHTTIAELAIERAKRLVELGHDVVVLVDSLTRLARALQQSVGGGRSVAGDTAWLYPTKKLFGAARNVENGGSLTIIGTLVTHTGLPGDDIVASEVAGSATLELHVSHQAAAARMFPALDIAHSATRKDDHLLGKDEANVVGDVRKALGAHDSLAGLGAVLGELERSSSNVEFLVGIQKKLPSLGL